MPFRWFSDKDPGYTRWPPWSADSLFFNQLRSESFTNEVCIVIPRYSRVQEWHKDSKAWLRNTKALSAEITFTGGKVLVVVSTFFEQVHNYAIALEQG